MTEKLLKKWEKLINSNKMGDSFQSQESIILAVNFLEAQFRYNKSLLYSNPHQIYALSIIRRIFPKIVNIHESYLNNLEDLKFDSINVATSRTVVHSTLDTTPIFGMDIEFTMMELVEYDVTPIILNAIKEGTLLLGHMMHFNLEYDGDSKRTITTYLNIQDKTRLT